MQWRLQNERLRGFNIENKLQFDGLHDRQVARLFAFEYTARIHAGLTVGVGHASAVHRHSSSFSKAALTRPRNARQTVPHCQRAEFRTSTKKERISSDNRGLGIVLDERPKCGAEVAFVASFCDVNFETEYFRCRLHILDICTGPGVCRID